MGLILRLAEAAEITVNSIGSLDLVASRDVDAFLRAAEKHKAVILGIEGFRINAGRPIPDTDAIADFSSLANDPDTAATTIKEARRFLFDVSKPDMHFDFTIAEAMAER